MNPLLILLIIVVAIIATSFVVVQQGTISVITMFGKYRRILSPGLNFRIPLIEKVATNISIQNRSLEMEFQAITQDQANVYFKAMLVYSVLNADEETIKNVAFVRTQIEQSIQYFAKEEVAEIWITFPDPQLRLSKAKKRLTHPQFLRLYQQFLKPGGIIHLKTDSPNLYLFTKTVIELYGLTLITATDDVYGTAFMQSDKWDERCAIKTYYEGLNIASSNRIHYIQFKIDKALPIAKDETLKEMIAAFEVTETHDAKRERGVKANEN
jgi:hypothetical protein